MRRVVQLSELNLLDLGRVPYPVRAVSRITTSEGKVCRPYDSSCDGNKTNVALMQTSSKILIFPDCHEVAFVGPRKCCGDCIAP